MRDAKPSFSRSRERKVVDIVFSDTLANASSAFYRPARLPLSSDVLRAADSERARALVGVVHQEVLVVLVDALRLREVPVRRPAVELR